LLDSLLQEKYQNLQRIAKKYYTTFGSNSKAELIVC